MSDSDDLHIRSFGVVFALDRRLHRIDRWRLPLPYGLPLRSIGYAAATLVVVVILSRLPVMGALLTALPVPVRFALLPATTAYALTSVRVDGRPAHEAFVGLVAWVLRPTVVTRAESGVALDAEVRFGDVQFAPDAAGARLRAGVVRGPATVRVRYPGKMAERRRRLVLEQATEEPLESGFEIAFDRRHRLVVR